MDFSLYPKSGRETDRHGVQIGPSEKRPRVKRRFAFDSAKIRGAHLCARITGDIIITNENKVGIAVLCNFQFSVFKFQSFGVVFCTMFKTNIKHLLQFLLVASCLDAVKVDL